MKRALMINAVCGIRSTGRICTDLAKDLEEQGYEVKIAYGRETVPEQYQKYAIRIGNTVDVYWHALMTRLFDDRGYWSKKATKKFLQWADEYNPELLWLHNLHDYFINIDMLFDWIKSRPQMQVKWTQHDCWAFTGRCFHFVTKNCNQWETRCVKCPYKTRLPIIKRVARNYNRKKELMSGVQNMTIITPSEWMGNLVRKSFLTQYDVQVVYNKIDLSAFKPTPSGFKEKYNLEDKKIVLGVASAWVRSKGLYDFIEISKLLPIDFVVVLVGLTQKQIHKMPNNIISILKTNSKEELASIYSCSYVFLNPTYEDTYPTVNLEAQACGLPVLTYRTGGSPESVPTENIIEVGDYKKMVDLIISGGFSRDFSHFHSVIEI